MIIMYEKILLWHLWYDPTQHILLSFVNTVCLRRFDLLYKVTYTIKMGQVFLDRQYQCTPGPAALVQGVHVDVP